MFNKQEIKRNTHFVNYRNLDQNDALTKVESLLNFVNNKEKKLSFFTKNYNIDEII